MKKELLLTIATGLLYTTAALAQTCTTPPSCESLGYTETEAYCSSGKMLKCPFDQTKVFCAVRYTSEIPVPGAIYYSDGTISESIIANKTPVGVVAYVNGDSGLIIGLEETKLAWSPIHENLTCVQNMDTADLALSDKSGSANTSCMAHKGSYSYPAASYCNSYAMSSGTYNWYLPAAGELYLMRHNYEVINRSLQNLSKTSISSSYYWTSSEHDNSYSYAWTASLYYGDVKTGYRRYANPVRCIRGFHKLSNPDYS